MKAKAKKAKYPKYYTNSDYPEVLWVQVNKSSVLSYGESGGWLKSAWSVRRGTCPDLLHDTRMSLISRAEALKLFARKSFNMALSAQEISARISCFFWGVSVMLILGAFLVLLGSNFQRENAEKDAVAHGYAEYFLDKDSNKQWRWKEKP